MATPSALPPLSKDAFEFPSEHVSALYLHGYSSTPYEVLPLATSLREFGVGGRGIILPGHATKVEDLADVTSQDWLAATEDALASLGDEHPRIIVAASMGALLALIVAAQASEDTAVDALVLLAPSLRLKPLGELGQRVGRSLAGEFLPLIEKAESGGDVGDPEGQAKNPTYGSMDISAIGELGHLRDLTVSSLTKVKCPILLFHGARDRTVELDATTEVATHVSSEIVETIFLPKSQHILGLDVERDEIARRTVDFLSSLFPTLEA